MSMTTTTTTKMTTTTTIQEIKSIFIEMKIGHTHTHIAHISCSAHVLPNVFRAKHTKALTWKRNFLAQRSETKSTKTANYNAHTTHTYSSYWNTKYSHRLFSPFTHQNTLFVRPQSSSSSICNTNRYFTRVGHETGEEEEDVDEETKRTDMILFVLDNFPLRKTLKLLCELFGIFIYMKLNGSKSMGLFGRVLYYCWFDFTFCWCLINLFLSELVN